MLSADETKRAVWPAVLGADETKRAVWPAVLGADETKRAVWPAVLSADESPFRFPVVLFSIIFYVGNLQIPHLLQSSVRGGFRRLLSL